MQCLLFSMQCLSAKLCKFASAFVPTPSCSNSPLPMLPANSPTTDRKDGWKYRFSSMVPMEALHFFEQFLRIAHFIDFINSISCLLQSIHLCPTSHSAAFFSTARKSPSSTLLFLRTISYNIFHEQVCLDI